MNQPRGILESLLFLSQEPLPLRELAAVFDDVPLETWEELAEQLRLEYEENPDRGLQIVHVAGGYQMRTRPQLAEDLRMFFRAKPQRLSAAAMETLAIIAYKQPIIRADIERIRGVDCGGTIKGLIERGLIKVKGRHEIPGRPLIYVTAKKFLEVFNLESLRDLPTLKELSDLAPDTAASLDLFPEEEMAEVEEAPNPDAEEPPAGEVEFDPQRDDPLEYLRGDDDEPDDDEPDDDEPDDDEPDDDEPDDDEDAEDRDER